MFVLIYGKVCVYGVTQNFCSNICLTENVLANTPDQSGLERRQSLLGNYVIRFDSLFKGFRKAFFLPSSSSSWTSSKVFLIIHLLKHATLRLASLRINVTLFPPVSKLS